MTLTTGTAEVLLTPEQVESLLIKPVLAASDKGDAPRVVGRPGAGPSCSQPTAPASRQARTFDQL